MAKRCPSCGYEGIGPFTDNCPICAEPVRNVRSDTGGSARPTWLWWVLGGALVAVLGVVGCCGLGMWRLGTVFQDAGKTMVEAMEKAKAKAEADRQARTVVVTAADLLQEFAKDPAAADKKYAGKYLEISGVVEKSGRGRHDVPFVILAGRDEKAKVKIECFFDLGGRKDEAQIKRLEKGQTIKVRGEYDGQVSNVQVRECILIQNGSKEGP
jgi:hypothetical protein